MRKSESGREGERGREEEKGSNRYSQEEQKGKKDIRRKCVCVCVRERESEK